ncbi:MAG: hypothetical protein H0X37_26035 [Herpetosiphonaceae bacterium]|nr:hypothetical protein [Herpetosiphonaceae bacterium]
MARVFVYPARDEAVLLGHLTHRIDQPRSIRRKSPVLTGLAALVMRLITR